MVRQERLWWFGHVASKIREDYVPACRALEVRGALRMGRGRKTWMDRVAEGMKNAGLKKEDAPTYST